LTTGCGDADKVKGYDCVANDDGDKCIQVSKCEKATENCDKVEVPSGYKCEAVKDKPCKLVSTATNSSNSLNIFKKTFALLIIFIIL
jgi:hypothetical protein